MNKYEIRVIPKTDDVGKTYWSAFYPAIEECVGGGDTIEEAVIEAQQNLEIYLEYLKDEKIQCPDEYKEFEFSGKIALRVSKSTHSNLHRIAEDEGISVNSLINNAIECYLGKKHYDIEFNKKIDVVKELTEYGNALQTVNIQSSNLLMKELWKNQSVKYN